MIADLWTKIQNRDPPDITWDSNPLDRKTQENGKSSDAM
jgi:hypothetical protein